MSRHSIQPYTHNLKIFQPKRRYPAAAPRSESPHVPPPQQRQHGAVLLQGLHVARGLTGDVLENVWLIMENLWYDGKSMVNIWESMVNLWWKNDWKIWNMRQNICKNPSKLKISRGEKWFNVISPPKKKQNWDFSGQKVDLIRNFSGIWAAKFGFTGQISGCGFHLQLL